MPRSGHSVYKWLAVRPQSHTPADTAGVFPCQSDICSLQSADSTRIFCIFDLNKRLNRVYNFFLFKKCYLIIVWGSVKLNSSSLSHLYISAADWATCHCASSLYLWVRQDNSFRSHTCNGRSCQKKSAHSWQSSFWQMEARHNWQLFIYNN